MRTLMLISCFTLSLRTTLANDLDALFVHSPDHNIEATIHLDQQLSYSVHYREKTLLERAPISMSLNDGTILGRDPKLKRQHSHTVDQILAPIYGKRARIRDHFNELQIQFRGGYGVIFRVYDEGIAYRITLDMKDSLHIVNEQAEFPLQGSFQVWAMHSADGSFQHSYENVYTSKSVSELSDSLIALPVLIATASDVKMLLTEADLEDYPGMHLQKSTSGDGLQAVFPAYPLAVEPGGHHRFNLIVKERAAYMAAVEGKRKLPWRVIKIAENDPQLLDTDLVYKLCDPAHPDIDFSWVRPGKVAWDWWNALNLTGVDFRTGVNTESYLYFIDFAAENGIEYVNLDEGWSDQYDLMKLNNDIDLEKILEYASARSVGVFLWCVHWPLDEKMEEAMTVFQNMGVAGLKIDFMDRDDQVMVDYYHRVARAAAQHELLVNFHGAYKPAGIHRKYPNVLNREAVRGLEYNKFARPNGTSPEYAVTIPFIRMAAGPMDYTPGAMTNAQKDNFGVFFERPMSQGTRCQQLAMYVLYEAPLQMLSDTPTAYRNEPEVLRFIAGIPTTWDETIALSGEVGDYAVLARKKGDAWYVAGMTDWTARTIAVDFSFLGAGSYSAVAYQDGINADRNGNDYKKLTFTITAGEKRAIHLAPGGGFALRIEPE